MGDVGGEGRPGGRAGRTRPRVVVVEDDRTNRALLKEVLEAEGIDVVGEAGDGAQGLDVVRKVHPDVVLMDLRMPGTGGIEAIRLIKQEVPHTQVIVLTAYDGPLPERSAHEVGAYAYLVKGCSPQLMGEVIVQAQRWGAAQLRRRVGHQGAC